MGWVDGLDRQWWSVPLPGVRPPALDEPSTYLPFDRAVLPPVRTSGVDWLRDLPPQSPSVLDSDQVVRPLGPDLLTELDVPVPADLAALASEPLLLRAIRSCTDCYVDVGDHVLRPAGPGGGVLVHLLSDSQWVGHWLLHVDPDGRETVLATGNALGYVDDDEPGPDDRFDARSPEVVVVADSLVEFLHRTWLDHEAWYALRDGSKPHPEVAAYLAATRALTGVPEPRRRRPWRR